MFIISLNQKKIRKLFNHLIFSSFEDNKVPDKTPVSPGPTIQLGIHPNSLYENIDQELPKKVEEIKAQLVKSGIREYISAPAYMMDANGGEMFVLNILIVQSRIEVARQIPSQMNVSNRTGPPGGPLIQL